MRPGFTIFILFFGISLLEAIRTVNWPRVGFWLLIGVFFLALDQRSRLRRTP